MADVEILGFIPCVRDDEDRVMRVVGTYVCKKTGDIIGTEEYEVREYERQARETLQRLREVTCDELLVGLRPGTKKGQNDYNFEKLAGGSQLIKIGLGEVLTCHFLSQIYKKPKEEMLRLLQRSMVSGKGTLGNIYKEILSKNLSHDEQYEAFIAELDSVTQKKIEEFKELDTVDFDLSEEFLKLKRSCAYAFSPEHKAWLSEVWDFFEEKYMPILQQK